LVLQLIDKTNQQPLLTVVPQSLRRDADRTSSPPAEASRVAQLEHEIEETREERERTIRELEDANQELRAANEEALSVNEEFQLTNEELSTTNNHLHETLETQRRTSDDL